jgi:hypothetical protein
MIINKQNTKKVVSPLIWQIQFFKTIKLNSNILYLVFLISQFIAFDYVNFLNN